MNTLPASLLQRWALPVSASLSVMGYLVNLSFTAEISLTQSAIQASPCMYSVSVSNSSQQIVCSTVGQLCCLEWAPIYQAKICTIVSSTIGLKDVFWECM